MRYHPISPTLIQCRHWRQDSVRALFLFLAHKEGFKNCALKFRFFRDTAFRFVAGETLDNAIQAVRQANRQSISATLDLLGENTRTPEDARSACKDIIGILERIRLENVDCNVSVKLSQLGLGLDMDLAFENLLRIVQCARDHGNFIRVDMEDSPYLQRTLEVVTRVHAKLDNVGTVIQSYLYRSEQDVLDLLEKRIRIRLVKGAYLEPDNIAFRKKKDTDANFIRLMEMLLVSKIYHAIATHDETMINATKEYARSRDIPRSQFEFQMLYGVRRDLQLRLVQEGYPVRVYIPYGQRWYPYFMRRLAERPANVFFIARNLFKELGNPGVR
jgi:proline dehydrogenase